MDGSRTTTGAVVSPHWTPSLSLRFSPLVPVQPGETTVRWVILDPPMAGLLIFIFKLLFLENYKRREVQFYLYLEFTISFMKWNWKKKTRIWSSGILLKVSGIPLTIESGIHRESSIQQ